MDPRTRVETDVCTFLDGFQHQVDRRPHAPAITQRDVTLTYAQLDHRSTALARHLASAGIGPDSLVGLMLDRSPDMVVALLGVLKAGAAYVPLDPAFPADRLAFMIADSRPATVISHSSLTAGLPPDVARLCLDTDLRLVEARGHPPLDGGPEPADRAYVIYTSGSTGRPKGVEITHGSVLNLLESLRSEPGIHATDVVLAHTTLSFDIAVVEIWLPLFVGARILMAGPERGTDARTIAALLASRQATFVQATPSLWRLLLDAGWTDGRGLKILSGGEPLSRELADALLATGGDVWNLYGPTETTVWSSVWHVEKDGPILIGHPIRDTEMFVLDADLNPVGPREIGELCIGGAGLARGYLERPDQTAERFVPHPFRAGGARLYRTGDEARAHGASDFECLGRIDRQVKVDGFRIEPAEIESTLTVHPDVKQAIVCAAERAPGDRRLVAYVVPESRGVNQDELRALVRSHLPVHMMPSTFVTIPNVPLTPNGKVDRGALPAPDWRAPAGRQGSSALNSPLQRRLADMWCAVLGIDGVGADDNFFDIGGRSRLGAELFARIERELGPRLPLATLFEAPTLAALARAIERSDRTSRLWRCLVPINPHGSIGPLFCVHPVGGNVLAYRDLARRLGSSVKCYGIQAAGLDGVAQPVTHVEDMARKYMDEIRSVQPHGPYHLCGFSFGGLVAFEMALQFRSAGEPVGLLALLDTDFPEYSTSPGLTWLREFPVLRRQVYPIFRRGWRHARSLRRLGPAGYIAATAGRRQSAAPSQKSAGAERDLSSAAAERVRKANTRAAIDYLPRAYDGVITYFRAEHAALSRDRRALWSSLAHGIDVVNVEGAHSDLRLEPQVGIVARELRARLAPPV
jgi:amino acid adenylation domain-containing protein